eukprot:362438-Prymnesium_polylepis.1
MSCLDIERRLKLSREDAVEQVSSLRTRSVLPTPRAKTDAAPFCGMIFFDSPPPPGVLPAVTKQQARTFSGQLRGNAAKLKPDTW